MRDSTRAAQALTRLTLGARTGRGPGLGPGAAVAALEGHAGLRQPRDGPRPCRLVTRLVVLPTGFACALTAPPRSAIGAALHALNILISRQVTDAVRRYRAEVEIVVVLPLCPLSASPVDFAGCGALIDRARRSTEAWLRDGVEMSDGVPHQLPPHSHYVPGGTYGPLWLRSTGSLPLVVSTGASDAGTTTIAAMHRPGVVPLAVEP